MRLADMSLPAIVNGVRANHPILVLNAIIAGTKFNVCDPKFVKGVLDAERCETQLLNIPIKHVANAALHLLGIKEYQGDDLQVKAMIESKFAV